MQRILIASRNDGGRRVADRLRGVLDASLHVSCEDSVAPAAGMEALEQAVQGADRLLVIVDEAWAGLGVAALENEDGRWLVHAIRTAFESGTSVIAVAMDGAEMPVRDGVPDDIARFAEIEAFEISSANWAEDVSELVEEVSAELPTPAALAVNDGRRQILFAAGLIGLLVVIGGVLVASRTWFSSVPQAGSWTAEVDYGRGVVHRERLEFRETGAGMDGSASLFGARRVIEGLVREGERIAFHTRSQETLVNERRELRHDYVGVMDGADAMHFTLRTTGGFSERPVIEFEARRVQ